MVTTQQVYTFAESAIRQIRADHQQIRALVNDLERRIPRRTTTPPVGRLRLARAVGDIPARTDNPQEGEPDSMGVGEANQVLLEGGTDSTDRVKREEREDDLYTVVNMSGAVIPDKTYIKIQLMQSGHWVAVAPFLKTLVHFKLTAALNEDTEFSDAEIIAQYGTGEDLVDIEAGGDDLKIEVYNTESKDEGVYLLEAREGDTGLAELEKSVVPGEETSSGRPEKARYRIVELTPSGKIRVNKDDADLGHLQDKLRYGDSDKVGPELAVKSAGYTNESDELQLEQWVSFAGVEGYDEAGSNQILCSHGGALEFKALQTILKEWATFTESRDQSIGHDEGSGDVVWQDDGHCPEPAEG